MNKLLTLGGAAMAGAIVIGLAQGPRHRLRAAVARRMHQRMERMMANLPENAPPKLIVSVLPEVRDQNERILAMLQEQNALLREYLQKPH